MIDTASIKKGDWCYFEHTDNEGTTMKVWAKITKVDDDGTLWSGGVIFPSDSIEKHRPHDRDFKAGDIIEDRLIKKQHTIHPGQGHLIGRRSLAYTLVKPVESIEEEQKETPKPWIADAKLTVNEPPLTPIAGPPDLDGVPDEALFLLCVPHDWDAVAYKTEYLRTIQESYFLKKCRWHIYLGVIEEPTDTIQHGGELAENHEGSRTEGAKERMSNSE